MAILAKSCDDNKWLGATKMLSKIKNMLVVKSYHSGTLWELLVLVFDLAKNRGMTKFTLIFPEILGVKIQINDDGAIQM